MMFDTFKSKNNIRGKVMKKIILTLVLIFLCISLFADINDELMEAANAGDVEKVQRLIEQGADVNAKNENFRTALMYAAWGGYTEIAKLLIQAGVDINDTNDNGHTALI